VDEQSDRALRASLRKVYGSIRAMSRVELRRRLLMTPEFFYFADQMIEQAMARGILRPAMAAGADATHREGADPRGHEDDADWLEIVGDDTGGRLVPG